MKAAVLSENLTTILAASIAAICTLAGVVYTVKSQLKQRVGTPNGRGDLYQMVHEILVRLDGLDARDRLLEQRDQLLDERQAQLEREHADHRARLQHIERTTAGRALGDPLKED